MFENITELIRKDEYREAFIREIQEVGYGMWWQILRARDFRYPHKRERVFVLCWNEKLIANADSFGFLCTQKFFNHYAKQDIYKPSKEVISICREYSKRHAARDYEVHCSNIRGGDGFSTFLHKIKGLGNSIIPDIATLYGRVMAECC